MKDLSSSQLNKLFNGVTQHFADLESPAIAWGQQERTLTKSWVGPKLKQYVDTLLIPQMVLRYDGSTAVRPLLKYGMTFLPDAHLNLGHQRICAIEVKFLRDSDPSGSLTKAIGQTLMYRTLGYEMSLGLIFDLRKSGNTDFQNDLDKISDVDNRISFNYYKC
jgi:hypothetical protein